MITLKTNTNEYLVLDSNDLSIREYENVNLMKKDKTAKAGTVAVIKNETLYEYKLLTEVPIGTQIFGCKLSNTFSGTFNYHYTLIKKSDDSDRIFAYEEQLTIYLQNNNMDFYIEFGDDHGFYYGDTDISEAEEFISDGTWITSGNLCPWFMVKLKIESEQLNEVYMYNGNEWDLFSKSKPNITWKRVRHIMPYNAIPGYVYTGRYLDNDLMNKFLPLMPAINFSKANKIDDDDDVYDISKFGSDCFYTDEYTSNELYDIDSTNLTIIFYKDPKIAYLKFPDDDINPNTASKFLTSTLGYYIDRKGRLKYTHCLGIDEKINKSFTEEMLDQKLDPIENVAELLQKIGTELTSTNTSKKYKNTLNRKYDSLSTYRGGKMILFLHKGIDALVFTMGKWVRPRFRKRLCNFRSINSIFAKDCLWDTLKTHSSRKNGSRYYTKMTIRVRRTNHDRTRFSDWTYWKIVITSGPLISTVKKIKNKYFRYM